MQIDKAKMSGEARNMAMIMNESVFFMVLPE
jgi:hypothetical protein